LGLFKGGAGGEQKGGRVVWVGKIG